MKRNVLRAAFGGRWMTRLVFGFVAAIGAGSPAGAQQLPDYLVNPGDTLDISVWKEPDLTMKVIVRPDGKLSVPLAGDVVAAGRTIVQIQTEITSRLIKYIPEAVVTATLTGIDGNRVYVIGQVTKPGTFVMNPRLSVLQALSLAGGMTPFAGVNDIIVLRGAGAHQKVLRFRYGDVSKGKSLEENVPLEAGDVVIVP
jgi:polysaccharide export outer membrane protein